MTIPFGRQRRLVLTLVAAPSRAREHPAAVGASDQELARLARADDAAYTQLTTQALRFRIGLR
jgi:hypothetical protein